MRSFHSFHSKRYADPNAPELHVNLARASSVFEMAALDKIIEAKDANADEKRERANEACELLVVGIRQDLHYKQRSNGNRSLRLFDLFATIIFRCGLAAEFESKLKDLSVLADPQVQSSSNIRRQHRFVHTRFKPADFKVSVNGEALPIPNRLRPEDKLRWKEHCHRWETRKAKGPLQKNFSKNESKQAEMNERDKNREKEWLDRKTKWFDKQSKFRVNLADQEKKVTWRPAFSPASVLACAAEIKEKSDEEQRKSKMLNIPLDIPAIEIPFSAAP